MLRRTQTQRHTIYTASRPLFLKCPLLRVERKGDDTGWGSGVTSCYSMEFSRVTYEKSLTLQGKNEQRVVEDLKSKKKTRVNH